MQPKAAPIGLEQGWTGRLAHRAFSRWADALVGRLMSWARAESEHNHIHFVLLKVLPPAPCRHLLTITGNGVLMDFGCGG